ncbi:hypothetical protein RUMHYD_02561, partial [Blautia hydrogenotrophica DSM 10507]
LLDESLRPRMTINTGMIKFVIRKINHSAIEIPPIYYNNEEIQLL